MPQARNIAALLAVSALLLAGWMNATHWHFHGAPSGQANGLDGSCCSAAHESLACHSSSDPVSVSDSGRLSGAQSSHLGDGCSICDFLASHVFGLAMIYEFAGMLAEGQLAPEPLLDSPASEMRWAACRGPPLAV